MPKTLDNEEETKLLAFKAEVMKITRDYISSNCDSKGNQKLNVTVDQFNGMKSLKRRCKQEDLVVMETDKSKRLSIMTKQNYIESTEPHVKDDQVVSEEELSGIEKLLNGHSLQLTRAFMISYEQADFYRLKQAMTNFSIEPPPLRAVRKDHKIIPAHQQDVGPPSRPIGDGNNAPDTQLSWILALVGQKAADSLDSQSEF